jgi:hypothetical protein
MKKFPDLPLLFPPFPSRQGEGSLVQLWWRVPPAGGDEAELLAAIAARLVPGVPKTP